MCMVNTNLPGTPPFLENDRSPYHMKKADLQREGRQLTCREKQLHACSEDRLYSFQPVFGYSILSFGFIYLFIYFFAPNPSKKFLFGPMLVPSGRLSLAMKKSMNSRTMCKAIVTREPPPRQESKHRVKGTHAFSNRLIFRGYLLLEIRQVLEEVLINLSKKQMFLLRIPFCLGNAGSIIGGSRL